MPFKDPHKRREYARKYYSSPAQKGKKRKYDHDRYKLLKGEISEKNSRNLYPHRYVYDGEWVCSHCGSTNGLVIHHMDFNHSNNDPSNLVCLCRSCHASLHANHSARDQNGRFAVSSHQ